MDALHRAVSARDLAAATKLLRDGHPPDSVGDYGETAVAIAMRGADRSMLTLLLRHGADPRAIDADKCFPIGIAAIRGDLEAIRVVAEYAADFESPVPGEPSALALALACGQRPVAEYLLRHGADPFCRGYDGRPLWENLSADGMTRECELLLRWTFDMPGIGRPSGYEGYESRGQPAGASTSEPSTAKSRAAPAPESRRDRLARIKGRLLRPFEQVSLKLRLRLPRAREQVEAVAARIPPARAQPKLHGLVDALLTCPAQQLPRAREMALRQLWVALADAPSTALQVDWWTGRSLAHAVTAPPLNELATRLIDAGLLDQALNRSDACLDRPLHLAARAGMPDVVQALIARGADVNAVNRNGLTPLQECSHHLDAATATLLLESGANVRLGRLLSREEQPERTAGAAAGYLSALAGARSRAKALTVFSPNSPFQLG